MSNRRSFLQRALGLGAGLRAAPALLNAQPASRSARKGGTGKPAFNTPVITTDVGDMPFTMDGNTKVFHLVAQVVKQRRL